MGNLEGCSSNGVEFDESDEDLEEKCVACLLLLLYKIDSYAANFLDLMAVFGGVNPFLKE